MTSGAASSSVREAVALRERAQAALRARFGATDWVAATQPVEARKSSVLLFHSPSLGRHAALKVYREPDAARQQASALRQAASAMAAGAQPCSVPELYAEFDQPAALLLEWFTALHLEQVLVRAALAPARHRDAVRAAGGWLRRFHELGGIAPGRFESERYADQIRARRGAAPLASARLETEAWWRAALAQFERGLLKLDGRTVPTALTHGDFTSTNVLLTAERVVGIDLWCEVRAPIVDDLARMFVYLAMGDVQPLQARVVAVPFSAWRAQQALFAGYGPDALATDTEVWHQVVLYEALARYLALGERLARRWSPTERWKQGGLRALLRVLVSH